MNIIVLGASGQIGSVIFEGLKIRHDVIGTSRKADRRYVQFDPFSSKWSSLGKTDVLINCIGQIAPSKGSSFYHVHVDLTKLLIKNRETIGNPMIIQISALGASAHHRVEFLKTKGIADDLLLQIPDTVIVRPSIVCTPRTMIVKKMLMMRQLSRFTQSVLFVPKGFLKTRIQPVMPKDLVDVVDALCMGRCSQRIAEVVGPRAISFREIIETMFGTTKKKFRLVEVPKVITDALVNYFIGIFFPSVVNLQQYQLLFDDNTADKEPVEEILHRPLLSTEPFFMNEFRDARN